MQNTPSKCHPHSGFFRQRIRYQCDWLVKTITLLLAGVVLVLVTVVGVMAIFDVVLQLVAVSK